MRVTIGFIGLSLVFGVLFAAPSSHAEEQYLNLWANQRASHQAGIEASAEEYKARGQAYVDHLYATNGEEPMPDPQSDIHYDEFLEDMVQVNPEEVDLKGVQQILSDNGSQEDAQTTAQETAQQPVAQ